MRHPSKLAHLRGTLQTLHIGDVVSVARRALESRLDRAEARPLREIDRWSDQAEVAFVEERCAGRA